MRTDYRWMILLKLYEAKAYSNSLGGVSIKHILSKESGQIADIVQVSNLSNQLEEKKLIAKLHPQSELIKLTDKGKSVVERYRVNTIEFTNNFEKL